MFEGLQKDQLARRNRGNVVRDRRARSAPSRSPTCSRLTPPMSRAPLWGFATKLEAENRGIQLREVAGGWAAVHASRLPRAHREVRPFLGHAQALPSRHGNACDRGVYPAYDARPGGERARRELRQLHQLPGGKGPRARGGDRGYARATPLFTPRRARFWRSSACAPPPICPTFPSSPPTIPRARSFASVFPQLTKQAVPRSSATRATCSTALCTTTRRAI